jgi:hypothetical protein
MKNILNRFGVTAVIAASLMVMIGCLVSGTFVVITDIDPFCFSSSDPFYHYHVDLTTESEWNDHKDKIDFIDAVGFDFWIENHSSSAVTFSVYVDPHSDAELTSAATVKTGATKVFGDLIVAGNDSKHVTYGESLGLISNLTTLKAVVKEGKFRYYGLAEGIAADSACVDSAKAIITVSAGK